MDHGHILAQQLNGLGEHFLPLVYVFHVQKVHRVEQNLQIGAADLVQHGAGAAGVIHNVSDHRLNGNGHAVLLGAAHHRLEVCDKGGKITSGTCNTCIQTEYKFTGVASHAAGAPDKGTFCPRRGGAYEHGVQFLREHMPDSARIHYSITDAGGDSPNVVQPKAQVLYMVRSIWVKGRAGASGESRPYCSCGIHDDRYKDGEEVYRWLLQYRSEQGPGVPYVDNFNDLGVCHYTEEELKYAKALYDSVEMKSDKLPGDATEDSSDIYEYVDEKSKHGTTPMNEFLVPYLYYEKPRMGSTDVGDVSWCIPTAQINTSTFPAQAPGHSWQNVSCGRTSIAHKNMLLAGKVIAATAIDLMEKPDVLQAAKDEFNKKMKRYGGYTCPVPQGAVPVIPGEKM